jgi:hypothetical protein
VSLAQCAELGVTPQQAAGFARRKTWERVARAVYDTGLPQPDDGIHPNDRRRRRAAVLGLLAYPGSVATGLCALVLHGVQGAPLHVQPEVTFPDGSSRAAREPVRLRRIPLESWIEIDGFRCATVRDALAQAVPRLGRYHAVGLMDSAINGGLITVEDLDQARLATRGSRGAARTRSWWDQADARAESPAETWARLSCTDAGYPPDVLQLPVVDAAGRRLARVDLAWLLPDGGALLVEIDGGVHSLPSALVRDRERQNRIVTRSTILRRYTGAEAWSGLVGLEVARELAALGWYSRAVRPDVVLQLDR